MDRCGNIVSAILIIVFKWQFNALVHSYHSGQMCIAGSRIFVQEGVYDRFLQAFTAAAQSFKPGDGFDPDSNHGPLISETQLKVSTQQCHLATMLYSRYKRVMGYIDSGKADGATVVTGGIRKGDTGYFVEPTIFTDVKPDMKIIREEIFGPVCAVIKFKDEQEVIELANDTVYGLSSVVFTENISRAIRVAHALEAGQTFVSRCLILFFRSLITDNCRPDQFDSYGFCAGSFRWLQAVRVRKGAGTVRSGVVRGSYLLSEICC